MRTRRNYINLAFWSWTYSTSLWKSWYFLCHRSIILADIIKRSCNITISSIETRSWKFSLRWIILNSLSLNILYFQNVLLNNWVDIVRWTFYYDFFLVLYCCLFLRRLVLRNSVHLHFGNKHFLRFNHKILIRNFWNVVQLSCVLSVASRWCKIIRNVVHICIIVRT